MADEGESQKASVQDTGFIPGDDLWTRWQNTVSVLTGRLTPEGKAQYKQARDDRYEKSDCAKCEKQTEYLLQYSMRLRHMSCSVSSLRRISRPCHPIYASENQRPWRRYKYQQHLVCAM